MGLIKKISEKRELRKEEKELKQEERLILREMAQERLNKKRALEQKQKEFDAMLDMRLPCKNVIRLKHPLNNQVNYYLMNTTPFIILLLMQEGIQGVPCKFKQLTGKNAGNIYKGRFPAMQDYIHMCLNKEDRSKLFISIYGHQNDHIEQHFNEDTKLEKIYGKTMTLRQLLMIWKTDNGKFMNINIDEDFEMVKRLYDSEDILEKNKKQELSK